tara:strand:+ start:305 stop:739 length:435 start_codon:yes stop_codon:yes gene_type:complete
MRLFIFIIAGILFSNLSFAENTTIEMFNKLDKRNMVFSKEIVRIKLGDTVSWKATDKGHNVEFIMKGGVPEGIEKFKSKVGKDAEYTFSIPGIYAYWCSPHKTMGMIGFVIVDNDFSNIDSIKKIKYLGKSKKIASILIPQIEQ